MDWTCQVLEEESGTAKEPQPYLDKVWLKGYSG